MRYVILLCLGLLVVAQEPAPRNKKDVRPGPGVDTSALEPAPSPKPEQGPFLLHLTKDPSGTCLEGAVNNAGVLHKKCSKGSAYQKFNYAPSIGAFKLGKKCLGVPAIGSLRLMNCPDAAYQNHRMMWSCQQTQCCVSQDNEVCVDVKDGGNSWLPDIDVGSSSGIWNMVLWFIMLTLAMELILCLIKLLYRGVSSLCGVLKKQDVVADDAAGIQVSETKPLAPAAA